MPRSQCPFVMNDLGTVGSALVRMWTTMSALRGEYNNGRMAEASKRGHHCTTAVPSTVLLESITIGAILTGALSISCARDNPQYH